MNSGIGFSMLCGAGRIIDDDDSLPTDNFGGCWAALNQECPLFARKFPEDTADAVLSVWRNASSGLQII